MKSRRKVVPDDEAKSRDRVDRKATPVQSNLGGCSKLSRGLRPRKEAQPLPASPAVPAASGSSGAAQEQYLYKTPKRYSKRNQCLSAFSSPSSDAELQEEIFWDPQSPTLNVFGNEKRKRIGSTCTVEISEIVNRIPPQDKNQSNSEVAHLAMWIGEDAIPCTPGVVKMRGRTKLSDAKLKLKNSEEELMQLVKQFNKNLVDAVQHQDIQDHTSVSDTETLNNGVHEEAQVHELHSFLEEVPEADIALTLKPIKHSSVVPQLEPNEHSSQKYVDQEAEVAFNALFDCSTQRMSGRLSQSLLDASINCLSENKNVPRESSQYISKQTKNEEQHISKDLYCKQNSLIPCPSIIQMGSPKGENTLNIPKENVTSKTGLIESSIQTTMPIKEDELDEWGSKDEDLLKDDSFIMQITQNPELISTSSDDLPPIKHSKSLLASNENSKTKAKTNESSSLVAGVTLLTQSNNFQYVPSKANKGINNVAKSFSNSTDRIEKSKVKGSPLQNERTFKDIKIGCEKSTQNKVSGIASHISVKPEVKSAKTDFLPNCSSTINVSGIGSYSVSEHYNSGGSQSGNYSNNTHAVSQQWPSGSSTNKGSNGAGMLAVQTCTGKQNQLETLTKYPVPLDDWNDPKFCDEILDMFCESDSLWETDEKEDDDLLYQACDAIEKLTQTQDVMQENETRHELVQQIPASCKSYPNMSLAVTKQGQSCESLQLRHVSHGISSLDTLYSKGRAARENAIKCRKSAIGPANSIAVTEHAPAMNKSVKSQNCSLSVLTNKVAVKLSRSHSTNAEGFASEHCSVSYNHGENNSQNAVKTLSSSFANKASLVPSKFTFTKVKSSQLIAVHTEHDSIVPECTFQTECRNTNLGEGKNQSTIPLFQSVQISRHSSLKRHLSEASIQSAKEQRSQKCSQEEIERKKQEALARRKMRLQTQLKDTSPT
ncbi:ewing's tumor-associated antigen 1 isoform X2 [Rhinatrema bivittatum]|uniref:ewing's tumor-associated antigen 1 isoform X2 n=1 Tax=Rhinatrema bivittatum TaxID=194408 RepID=UPI001125F266|nr:ewing's tumor-associated antigen 1 isoform X2 [Rhinatrema bivittatum]